MLWILVVTRHSSGDTPVVVVCRRTPSTKQAIKAFCNRFGATRSGHEQLVRDAFQPMFELLPTIAELQAEPDQTVMRSLITPNGERVDFTVMLQDYDDGDTALN